MKYIMIDLYLKNNQEIFSSDNIEALYQKDILSFSLNEDKYEFKIKNMILKKENKDSILIFNFILNTKTEVQYYIKEFNSYINTFVKTNSINKNNNIIDIDYDLWIEDTFMGNYNFKIKIKE